MNKLFLSLLFLCFSCFETHAQNWQWAQYSTGIQQQWSYSQATDAAGNTYVAGSSDFSGSSSSSDNSIYFGGSSIVTTNPAYYFLVKYNTSGTAQWVQQLSLSSEDDIFVATDASGNVYMTGDFNSSTFSIGSYTVNGSGVTSIFLAKFDASGNVLWLQTEPSYYGAQPGAITTDNSGNVLLTGTFDSAITIGAYTLNVYDKFVAKFDGDGNALWATGYGTNGYDDGEWESGGVAPDAVTTDANGNVIVAGSNTSDTMYAGGVAYTTTTSLGNSMYVLKTDASGNILWVQTGGGFYCSEGSVDDNFTAVACDDAGNIYAGGTINSNSTYFNGATLSNSYGCMQMVLAKYNASGALEWLRNPICGDASCATVGGYLYGLAVRHCEGVYIIGQSSNDLNFGDFDINAQNFIVEFDTAGTAQFGVAINSELNAWVNAISMDTAGNVYVSGIYDSSCQISTDSLNLTGDQNIYVAKFGSDGTTHVSQQQVAGDVVIFPNPATDAITLQTGNSNYTTLVITNVIGQVVLSRPVDALMTQVNVQQLPAGSYYVTLSGGNNTSVQKFVKL